MRLKTELYPEQQDKLIERIIEILELDDNGMILLHDLDNDVFKQQKIMDLSDDLKKYFTYAKIRGLTHPNEGRPWLSIIKQVVKTKYKIHSINEYVDVGNGAKKHTVRYIFTKLKGT